MYDTTASEILDAPLLSTVTMTVSAIVEAECGTENSLSAPRKHKFEVMVPQNAPGPMTAEQEKQMTL